MTFARSGSQRHSVLVLGIGNPLRSDDGIGPSIADACTRRLGSACDILQLDGEATRVIEAWRDRELVVVVDAVCLGEPAGTIHDLVVDNETIRSLQDRTGAEAVSSHYAGIAEAISLGKALDRMPRSMRIIGIEPSDFSYGVGFSTPVAQSIGAAIECVVSTVQNWKPDLCVDADVRP